MFYELDAHDTKIINYNEVNSQILTVGYVAYDEFASIYEEMGYDEQTFQQLKQNSILLQNAALIYRNYSFGLFHIIDSENPNTVSEKFALYLSSNLLLIVEISSKDSEIAQAVQSLIDRIPKFASCSLSQLYVSFLTHFLSGGHQTLELVEQTLEVLEKDVLNDHIEQVRYDLFQYRRQLLLWKNYYEQFITITEELCENTNHLFRPEEIALLDQLNCKIKRLQEHTRDLSEYVSQIKESYMAQLDIDLNRTMKFFTVYTTIFMPLSLIVGWYGMNFKGMPEFTWKHGYLYVILLCFIVTILCIRFIRKHRF